MHKYNILQLSDIQRFYGCSHSVAVQRVKEIKKFFKRPYLKRISIHLLANYEGLTVEEVLLCLE